MITLNDYLYSGDTIFRILRNYTVDLKKEAKKNHNEIDLIHSISIDPSSGNCLNTMISLLHSRRKSGIFINTWYRNILCLLLLLKEGSSP